MSESLLPACAPRVGVLTTALGLGLITVGSAPAAENRLDKSRLAAGLAQGGIIADDAMLDGLTAEAAEHAIRVLDEADSREQLVATGVPILSLPRLVDGGDLGGVYELADRLAEQGVK